MSIVFSPIIFFEDSNACSKAVALHITIIASTVSNFPGSVVARIFIVLSPPWPIIFKPFLLISSTCCFHTSIRITLRPFSARSPPKRQPIAPAPSTATFVFLFTIKLSF